MGLLIFLQVVLDLAFIATCTFLFMERFKAKSMEDPRLSRGLQLLSSKIAIIQDLMDRTDAAGRQMTQLIDNKEQNIQERLEEAEVHLHNIRKATEKSQAVAQIFQDQIPHQEILNRQTTSKYLHAAKMAHQGFAIEDIAKQVDIPQGELELIVKVNRHRLIAEEPVWAKQNELPSVRATDSFESDVATAVKKVSDSEISSAVSSAVNAAAVSAFAADFDEEVGEAIAVASAHAPTPLSSPVTPPPAVIFNPNMARVLNSTSDKEVQVRPVIFKRIESTQGWES